MGRQRVHGWVPRVVAAPIGVAVGGTAPPRPAAVALWPRRETARISGVTSPLGCGAHLCLARPVATPEQGLGASAGDGRGHDLWRNEPHHAAKAYSGNVTHLHLPSVQIFVYKTRSKAQPRGFEPLTSSV